MLEELVNKVATEISEKRDIAILEFIKKNGFNSLEELEEKGFKLNINSSNLSSTIDELQENYLYQDRFELELVKVINKENNKINITVEFQDGLKLVEAMKSRSIMTGSFKRKEKTLLEKFINLFKI